MILMAGSFLYVASLASPLPEIPRTAAPDATDSATYQRELSRLRTGEPYYQVVGDELRRQRYPTLSVFKWRTPLLLTALARTPDAVGQGILIVLGVLLFGVALALAARESVWVAASSIMGAGAVVPVMVPTCLLMGETWAGILIGLSVCVYGRGKVHVAALLGLLALFLRELAAPYCVACTIIALVRGRRREVAVWIAGACLYAVYFGWHLLQVSAHQLPTDFAHESPAVGLNGLAILLTKVQYHAWLLVLPPWCAGLALTAVVAGTVHARTPSYVRVTSAVYLVFFLVGGRTFNGYWGLIAWPTWAIAFGYGVQLLRDAVARLASSKRPVDSPPAPASGWT
jgi:hypothetical protein